MARRHIFHRQPPVKGGRAPLPASVLDDLYAYVDADAKAYSCSRSWVVATILGRHYRVKEQIDFRTLRRPGEFGLKLVNKK